MCSKDPMTRKLEVCPASAMYTKRETLFHLVSIRPMDRTTIAVLFMKYGTVKCKSRTCISSYLSCQNFAITCHEAGRWISVCHSFTTSTHFSRFTGLCLALELRDRRDLTRTLNRYWIHIRGPSDIGGGQKLKGGTRFQQFE